jgi:hypothetical protein
MIAAKAITPKHTMQGIAIMKRTAVTTTPDTSNDDEYYQEPNREDNTNSPEEGHHRQSYRDADAEDPHQHTPFVAPFNVYPDIKRVWLDRATI